MYQGFGHPPVASQYFGKVGRVNLKQPRNLVAAFFRNSVCQVAQTRTSIAFQSGHREAMA
jgi:hypothetical protein